MKLRLTDNTRVGMCAGLLDQQGFQFTDSDGGVHNISGWESLLGYLNVNMPLFTCWLRDAEFKELDELAQDPRLHGLGVNETDLWDAALDAILWSASGQSSETALDKALSWALVDKTA